MEQNESIVINSNVHKNARLYRNVRIVKSLIGEDCSIGDFSDIVDSVLNDKAEVGRRCIVRNSEIGFGSYAGTNTVIKNVKIGKFCSISWNVSIDGGNHNYTSASTYTSYWWKKVFGLDFGGDTDTIYGTIGNDVWISSGVNILRGINIGNGAVIGAGAVVTKDVEPYSIIVGVPGRIIKKRFDNDIIKVLEDVKWWVWSLETIKKYAYLLREDITPQILNELRNVKIIDEKMI